MRPRSIPITERFAVFSSEELSAQAEMTRQLVEHLQELVGASRATTTAALPAAVAEAPLSFERRAA